MLLILLVDINRLLLCKTKKVSSSSSFIIIFFYSHKKKTLQGLQALQPNNNTKLIIKKTILKNKQNYTIYDDINGTSLGT